MDSFRGVSQLLFFICSCCLAGVWSLPTGAPATACSSMYPQHPGPNGPASAQPGLVVPFQIQVAPAQDGTRAYKITIVRNPNYPGQPDLLGFFMQIRDPNSDTPLGEWKSLPGYAKTGDCGGANSVTHVANAPKPLDQGGLVLRWEPTNLPLNTKSLQVLGTFVQSMQVFWVKVPSQIFSLPTDEPAAPTAVAVPAVLVNVDNAAVTALVGTTDMPAPTVVRTNVDSPNDRRPGFGNNGAVAGSAVVGPNGQTQQPSIRVVAAGSDAGKTVIGFSALLAGLVMAL